MDKERVSACSYPLQKEGLDYTFKVISEAGFKKIDLLAKMPHFSVTDPEFSLDELERVSDRYGVAVANIGSYCGKGFSSVSEDERNAAVNEIEKTLDAAKRLGAKSIRVTPGSGEREVIDLVVPYFQQAADRAEKHGVYMGIENHGGAISGNPDACKEISEKVGSKFFGILYEPCNLMACGVEYKAAFDTLRDHVVHVHFKDGKYDRDEKWVRTMLGDGIIDIQWVFEQVEGTGYDRDYALEFEVGEIEPVETGYKKWFETWKNA